MNRNIEKIDAISRKYGIRVFISTRRFMTTTPSGRVVHFGAWPVVHGTFIDHGDQKIRAA